MMGEWISAARAFDLISNAAPGQAAVAICTRAYDGMVRARAKRLVMGSRSNDDCDVPTSFWWARGHAALEQNWTTGDFETWIDHKIHCRAYGVEFDRAAIETMIPKKPPDIAFDRSSPGAFAPTGQCLQELMTTLNCDRAEGEQLILQSARAGLVTGFCKHIRWRVTDRYGSEEYEDSNVAIPDWFWEQCATHPDAVLNWGSGRLAGIGVINGEGYKVIISGAELSVSDIVDLETAHRRATKVHPKDEMPSRTETTQVISGRRQSDRWRPWIAELVAYIHDNGIPGGHGSQGQEELIRGVADALAVRGIEALGRSTVQPVVQAVLDRLRDAAQK